jgi:hypothetical protein
MRPLFVAVIATTAACELVVPSHDDLAGGTALVDAGATPEDATTTPPADAGGVSLVQQTTATAANASSVVVTLPAPPRNGDLLVVSITSFATTATPTFTVSGGGGGVVWSQQSKSSRHIVSAVWAGRPVTNGSAPVTVTSSLAQATLLAHVTEWSGVAAFGTALSSEGAGAPVTAPLQVGDGTALIYAMAATHDTAFGAPANGFVALDRVGAGNVAILAAYRLSPPSGSYTTTWPEPTPMNNGWDAHIVSFAR